MCAFFKSTELTLRNFLYTVARGGIVLRSSSEWQIPLSTLNYQWVYFFPNSSLTFFQKKKKKTICYKEPATLVPTTLRSTISDPIRNIKVQKTCQSRFDSYLLVELSSSIAVRFRTGIWHTCSLLIRESITSSVATLPWARTRKKLDGGDIGNVLEVCVYCRWRIDEV